MIDFLIFYLVMCVIIYPLHGGIVHGDPWRWIFKEPKQ